MQIGSSREVARHLRTLYGLGVAGSLTDEQLLGRFLAGRDDAAEEAFGELVQRHGPMVLGVCRRVLGDAHEAEDAFQATFLVLARKAASVVRREKVASWLYGVAVRTAREARLRSARRRAREERVSRPICVEPPDDASPAELREILDEELAKLPARHRGPVVLCELEGVPHPEAARRLGIPKGTLSSRLARAKARLRERLSARGVTLPAAALTAVLVREARAATVPLSLLESTVQAATLAASGPTVAATLALSASAASLSEGVIRTMLVAKLKGIAVAAGALTAVVSGAVVLAQPGFRPVAIATLPPGQPEAETTTVQAAPDAGPNDQPMVPRAEARRDPDDRVAALEKKLDQLLEARSVEEARAIRDEPDDRVAALEKKLDQLLEAMERASARPPVPDVAPSVTTRSADPSPVVHPDVAPSVNEPVPTTLPPPAAVPTTLPPPAAVAVSDGGGPLQGHHPAPSPSPELQPSDLSPARPDQPLAPTRAASLVERLQSVEGQMQQFQDRLNRLERRLKSLDARVGGVEVEQGVPEPARPNGGRTS